ncbi:MAG: VanW family protein [Gaiellaceae bacterium]
MTEIAARLARPIQRLGNPSAVFAALALVVAIAGVALLARAYTLREAVLPGVSVAGVEVGGLSEADARARIGTELGSRLDRPVQISMAGETFSVTPSNIFRVDAAASERQAFESARATFRGRLGALVSPLAPGRDIEPVLRIHASGRTALSKELSLQTKRPVSARVSMKGKKPVVVPGRVGTQVNEPALLAALRAAALAGEPTVAAPVRTVAPPVSTAAAERAATVAETIVAAPVTVRLKAKGEVGELGPRRLAGLIRFQPNAGGVDVVLDPAGIERQIGPLVERFTKKPVDASFKISGARAFVIKAKKGTTLDVPAAQAAVYEAAAGPGVRVASITLADLEADFPTKAAKALGIRERIATYTTDMGVSSPNRIWNVQLLGRYLNGTIVKPGKWFSYNKEVGPRTIERGFREGQMIFGGILIPSIGGGVCQTATTVFNAAFESGLPVKERRNHSWYISHYPMGRDAAVSWGGPDLVFKNDLEHAILIDVTYTDSTFTVSFFGTKEGRRVTSSTSSPANYSPPKMQYAIDPTAPRGSVRVVSGGGPGFDVNVHRKVYEHGKLLREDTFFTRYTPQNSTTVYGPGGKPPGPFFYLPSSG